MGRGVYTKRESPQERRLLLIEGWGTSFLFMLTFACINSVMRYGTYGFRDTISRFIIIRNDQKLQTPGAYLKLDMRISQAARCPSISGIRHMKICKKQGYFQFSTYPYLYLF